MAETSKKIRYTSVVRRGLGMLLEQGLERNVQSLIANATDPNKPRDQRYTKKEVAALVASIEWMKQETEGESEEGDDDEQG
jgi:hypothetical protein